MKHFFLWAVAISALCSSCETANEPYVENINMQNTNQPSQQRTVNDYNAYISVITSFVYNNQETHNNNLLRFQAHVNNKIPNANTTEVIDFNQLNLLENADNNFINQLNYSNSIKTAISSILNNTFNADDLALITNEQEYQLIATLYAIYNDGNGDDKWKSNRTIAFAYGAQYSLTKAVLYAGAIDLIKYRN